MGYPGAIIRLNPGSNPPETALAELYELPVNEKGEPTEIRVVKKLGLGLDEKAIEAVQKWRFKPGMKDGKAVAVIATIEVSFRLL